MIRLILELQNAELIHLLLVRLYSSVRIAKMFGPPVEDDERNPEADAKSKPTPTKAYSNPDLCDPNADVADETSNSIGKGIDLNTEVVGQS